MAIFNLFITIIGVQKIGAIAACIGTAIGLICANIIAMNIYYYKVLKLNVFRIFKNIFERTWLCCALSSFVLYISNLFVCGNWIAWLIKVAIFCIIYAITLVLYGLNDTEKNVLLGKIRGKNK